MSWILNITSITWVVNPSVNQTVNISFRQGGTSGAFTSAGTATFDSSGNIVGTPNPFQITAISDAWTSIEVDTVNACNSTDVLTTFNKP